MPEIIIWKTAPVAASHDKPRKIAKKLSDYGKSKVYNPLARSTDVVVRNGENYELRNGGEIISTKPYKPWFVAILPNGYFAHLPIKSKKDALKYCVENLPDFIGIEFDEDAVNFVLKRGLKERK